MSTGVEAGCALTVYVLIFLVHTCAPGTFSLCVCLHMFLACICSRALVFPVHCSFSGSHLPLLVCVYVYLCFLRIDWGMVLEGEVNEWWCYLFGLAGCAFSSEKSTVSLILSCPPWPGNRMSLCVCVLDVYGRAYMSECMNDCEYSVFC